MRPGRHYQRAPITEAVIDIVCELAPSTELDDLVGVVDNEQFPRKQKAIHFSGRIDVTEDGVTSDASGQPIGYIFNREDGFRVLQSRLNGFAYSALPPYERWESFSAEALLHWHDYQKVAHPTKVTRLGVRYVNRIDIPQASIEVKDYLRTVVDVSPYLPQMMNGYFMQVIVPLPRFDSTATITSTIAAPSAPDFTSLILDIDTWRGVSIPLDEDTSQHEIETQLEMLREAKNYVFESCITDATRGLIS